MFVLTSLKEKLKIYFFKIVKTQIFWRIFAFCYESLEFLAFGVLTRIRPAQIIGLIKRNSQRSCKIIWLKIVWLQFDKENSLRLTITTISARLNITFPLPEVCGKVKCWVRTFYRSKSSERSKYAFRKSKHSYRKANVFSGGFLHAGDVCCCYS